MTKLIDLTGQVFHRLTVVERDSNKPHRVHWICQCECGNTTSTQSSDLKAGKTKSCGCHRADETIARSTTHNLRFSSEYSVYCAMIARCHNPKNKRYDRYGARGITVCQEWRDDFSAFYNHIGPRPSLSHSVDRIDNNLGYMPGNVKWSDALEQANNKSNVKKYTYEGETMTLPQWSRKLSIGVETLRKRLNLGWSIHQTLSTPTNVNKLSSDSLGIAG